MGPPLTIAIDRHAHIAIAANVDGGSQGTNKCGIPKLIRSSDGGQITVCAPETKGFIASGDAAMPTLKFADNDKLYYAFNSRAGGAGLKPGIVLWRER
ncbi:hypothetical protein BH11GEM2_BH11GEM2_18900 [soil metagenome]